MNEDDRVIVRNGLCCNLTVIADSLADRGLHAFADDVREAVRTLERVASLQGADTVTEAMIAVVQEWVDGGFGVPNCAERVAIRAVLAPRTAAPTAQDDNGVRIEAQDDDAAYIRGLKGAVPFNGGLVNPDLERLERIASRLSADHTAASPDVPRHESHE